MSLNWKSAGLLFSMAVIGCSLALFMNGNSESSSGNALERRQEALTYASNETPVEPDLQHPPGTETRLTGSDARPTSRAQSNTAEGVLAGAEACMRPDLDDLPIYQSQLDGIWDCMVSLDWSVVTADDLASWLCAADHNNLHEACIIGAALYARQPAGALAFLSDFKPQCLNIRESELQIMAIEAIERVDPAWVARLAASMTPERLFTGSSSTQGLLLAEHFIRNGNLLIAAELEKGGRGEYGGSTDEIIRAARVSLFVTSTMQGDPNSAGNALAYAESLLRSPTCPPEIGSTIAGFLTNKQTWPGGDSKPALRTLLLAMDSPHYGLQTTLTVWLNETQAGPTGCDKALWKEIYEKAKFQAAKQGW